MKKLIFIIIALILICYFGWIPWINRLQEAINKKNDLIKKIESIRKTKPNVEKIRPEKTITTTDCYKYIKEMQEKSGISIEKIEPVKEKFAYKLHLPNTSFSSFIKFIEEVRKNPYMEITSFNISSVEKNIQGSINLYAGKEKNKEKFVSVTRDIFHFLPPKPIPIPTISSPPVETEIPQPKIYLSLKGMIFDEKKNIHRIYVLNESSGYFEVLDTSKYKDIEFDIDYEKELIKLKRNGTVFYTWYKDRSIDESILSSGGEEKKESSPPQLPPPLE
jgi:type II secretory pathway component PulM